MADINVWIHCGNRGGGDEVVAPLLFERALCSALRESGIEYLVTKGEAMRWVYIYRACETVSLAVSRTSAIYTIAVFARVV